MKPTYRKERIDRGIKVRSDEVFVIASYRDMLYLILPGGLAILFLLTFPLLDNVVGLYWEKVMLTTFVIALLALSWDFMASVGLISLGQSLFFGAGSYASGYLAQSFGLPPLVTIPLATLIGAAICTIILFPVLRLRGIYFGLISFALPLLLMRVIESTKIFGGNEGINGLPPLPGIKIELYIMMVITLGVVFIFRRITESNYGLVLLAIRDNDRSVIAGSYNIQWLKAQAVFIAALPAAFAGAFMTHHFQFVGLPAFALDYSIMPLTSVIIGGPGSFIGAVVGSFILMPLSETFRAFSSLRVVIYSLTLLVFVIGLPEGIFHYLARKYHQFERKVPLEEGKNEKQANFAS